MNNVRFVRRDSGRVATGYLVVFGTLVLITGALYFVLSSMGYLGGGAQDGPNADDRIDNPIDVDRPAWLTDANRELPPVSIVDEREPSSHILPDWLWDFVDESWSLEMFRDGTGGNGSLNDVQTLFLVAPDGIRFRLLAGLRTDYDLEVLDWDADDRIAWVARTGRPGATPVVELDLSTGVSDEHWLGTVAPATNTVGLGVVDVAPLGTLDNGRDLWVAYDQAGLVTGLFWRENDNFRRSLISDEIRRQRLQGFAESDGGLDAWIDVASARAVYRGTFRVDGAITQQVWLVHDLATDDIRQTEPQLPAGGDCEPNTGIFSAEHFDGDRIIAWCRSGGSATVVRIDPSGEQGPA